MEGRVCDGGRESGGGEREWWGGSDGEGVVGLGPRHRSCMMALGPCSHSRVVVISPHLLVLLASCCCSRVAICHSLGSEWWEGREGRGEQGVGTRAGSSSLFVHAGPSSPFTRAGVGPSSIHCLLCSSFFRWSFVAIWLIVFGCGCLPVTVVLVCRSWVVLGCHHHSWGGGCWWPVVAIYGCWWAWWAVVILGGGCGLLLVLVGRCGGSLTLVVSLYWCMGLVGCPGHLWLLVGMVGGHRMLLSVGGLEWVGWDGGAHQWTMMNDKLLSFIVWLPH